MMRLLAARRSSAPTMLQHVRAILLLPLTNTIFIPAAILAVTGAGADPAGSAGASRALGGSLLMAAGAGLAAHCVALLARVGRGTLAPWDPTRALVVEGAYRYSRNPLKLGLLLVLAGEALLLGSLPLLAWFACFALANACYIRWHEEAGLRARFGPSYREYCERVPRWLPRPRIRHAARD